MKQENQTTAMSEQEMRNTIGGVAPDSNGKGCTEQGLPKLPDLSQILGGILGNSIQ